MNQLTRSEFWIVAPATVEAMAEDMEVDMVEVTQPTRSIWVDSVRNSALHCLVEHPITTSQHWTMIQFLPECIGDQIVCLQNKFLHHKNTQFYDYIDYNTTWNASQKQKWKLLWNSGEEKKLVQHAYTHKYEERRHGMEVWFLDDDLCLLLREESRCRNIRKLDEN